MVSYVISLFFKVCQIFQLLNKKTKQKSKQLLEALIFKSVVRMTSLPTNILFFFITMCTGSILFVFHPTGSFLSGFLQERFGRKRCMVLANIPSIFGWIMLYKTHSVVSLYASTVLMGLSIGFSEAPILSYVGEITEPRLRGSMASLASTAGMLGMLLTYILGYVFEWRTVALLSTLCPITCICLVMLVC